MDPVHEHPRTWVEPALRIIMLDFIPLTELGINVITKPVIYCDNIGATCRSYKFGGQSNKIFFRVIINSSKIWRPFRKNNIFWGPISKYFSCKKFKKI